jgi:hypothetical protein
MTITRINSAIARVFIDEKLIGMIIFYYALKELNTKKYSLVAGGRHRENINISNDRSYTGEKYGG